MNKELRNTLLLAAVTLALGGYMWFVESKKPAETEADKKEEGTRVFTVEVKDVEEIGFEGSSTMTVVQSAPETWQVTSLGKTYEGDQASAGDLVSALNSLKARKLELDGGKATDADFGLDNPKQKITLKLKGKPPSVFMLGGNSPIQASRYIRLDKDTYVAKSFDLQPFERSPDDLRNKKLVRTEPAKVFKVTVHWRGSVNRDAELNRTPDGWKFSDPKLGKVDTNHLEDFLSELRLLRAAKFTGEGESAFADRGIDIAQLDVTLSGEKGDLLDRVRFGVKEPQTDGTWVWSDKFGEIVQVSKFSMDQMPSGPDWLTVKDEPKKDEEPAKATQPSAETGEKPSEPAPESAPDDKK